MMDDPNLDAFVSSLGARGLELRLTGNKLQVFDDNGRYSWPRLTDEDVAFIRANRYALKARLRLQPQPPEPKLEPVYRALDWNNPDPGGTTQRTDGARPAPALTVEEYQRQEQRTAQVKREQTRAQHQQPQPRQEK